MVKLVEFFQITSPLKETQVGDVTGWTNVRTGKTISVDEYVPHSYLIRNNYKLMGIPEEWGSKAIDEYYGPAQIYAYDNGWARWFLEGPQALRISVTKELIPKAYRIVLRLIKKYDPLSLTIEVINPIKRGPDQGITLTPVNIGKIMKWFGKLDEQRLIEEWVNVHGIPAFRNPTYEQILDMAAKVHYEIEEDKRRNFGVSTSFPWSNEEEVKGVFDLQSNEMLVWEGHRYQHMQFTMHKPYDRWIRLGFTYFPDTDTVKLTYHPGLNPEDIGALNPYINESQLNKERLNEETVRVKSPFRHEEKMGSLQNVVINPNEGELNSLVRLYGDVRVIVDKRNVYVWDAGGFEHEEIAHGMNLKLSDLLAFIFGHETSYRLYLSNYISRTWNWNMSAAKKHLERNPNFLKAFDEIPIDYYEMEQEPKP